MTRTSSRVLSGSCLALYLAVASCGGDDGASSDDDAGDQDTLGSDDSSSSETRVDSGGTEADVARDVAFDGDSSGDDTARADGEAGIDAADTGPLPDVIDGGGTDSSSPPTVHIASPTTNTKVAFTTSSTCQSIAASVTFTAPRGLKSLQWKLITPDGATAATRMTGTCGGLAAYGYFMDPGHYAGLTSGSFAEQIATAGSFSGTYLGTSYAATPARWWWCAAPGTEASTAFVSLAGATSTPPGAPGSAGYQTLSNYCYANSAPLDTDLAARWQFQVSLTDNAGSVVTDTVYFWLYK
jgi:hypothetical protein